MKRTIEIEMETKAKKYSTAVNRFFKKYPHIDYWRELVENMFETGVSHCDDTKLANGQYNDLWSYSIWAECNDDFYYIAIIERE